MSLRGTMFSTVAIELIVVNRSELGGLPWRHIQTTSFLQANFVFSSYTPNLTLPSEE